MDVGQQFDLEDRFGQSLKAFDEVIDLDEQAERTQACIFQSDEMGLRVYKVGRRQRR